MQKRTASRLSGDTTPSDTRLPKMVLDRFVGAGKATLFTPVRDARSLRGAPPSNETVADPFPKLRMPKELA